MRQWWAVLALVSLLAAPPPAHGQTASATPPDPVAPRVSVNGRNVSFTVLPQVRNGILIAQIVPLVQAFGGTIDWDPSTETLTAASLSGRVLRLVVGQTHVVSGDHGWDLPAAPTLEGGQVWGPAAAVLWGLGAYVKATQPAVVEAVSQVTGVAWQRNDDALAVTIATTGPVQAQGAVLHDPERLVVDLTNAVIRLPTREDAVGAAGVLRIRSAQFQVRPYVTRIVLDLDHPMPFTLTTGTATVTVALRTGTGAPAQGASIAPPPASASSGAHDEMSPSAGSSTTATGHAAAAGAGSSGGSASASSNVPAVERAAGDQAGGRPREGAPMPVAAATVGDDSGPSASQAHPTGAHAVTPGGAATQPVPPPRGEASIAPEPLALPPLPEFTDRAGAFHILGATYDEQDGTGRITVQATRPFTYVVHRFVYPDRLAIDIAGGVFRPRRRDLEIGTDAVRNIVITQFHLDPNLTRVEIHLNHKAAYALQVADGGRSLVLTLADSGQPGPRGQAVIIDPGHGGDDSGAVGPHGLREADVTLSIGRLTAQALERQGVHAVLTRTADTTVPLEERPDLAVRNGGVVFVSIHANASRDPAAIGTETYYETPESQALAALVQAEVVRALGEPDRGVRTADFYVIVNTPMPAILVEVAFISNPREEAMLRDPAIQRRVAEAIARGVLKFLAADRQAAVP